MYADVVVLTYQAPDINYFTYLVPKNLEKEIKVGQLVEVPFGKRTPQGIVIALNNHPEQREGSRGIKIDSFATAQNDKQMVIKPISSSVLKTPLLLPYQTELLKWMSVYYLAPMVNCLEAMLPEIPKRVAQLEGLPTARSQKSEKDFPNDFSKRALTGRKVVTGPAQTLVLVPTINRIAQTLAQFPKVKNYALYHNELKTAEKFAAWLKIFSGNIDFIFGSRSAIFTPCPNLSQIVIYDEHDGAYKDERSPYYGTLTVAQKISALTNSKIKIIDSSPKIQTYFSLTKNIAFKKAAARSIIVSMKEEKLAQNFGQISETLLFNLVKNQKLGKNSLLFLNKKKESGSLYCKSCQSHIYLEKQPETCPNCGSSDIFFNLLNISSLAKEVQKQIPSAKINLISDSANYPTTQLSNYPTIDIATASIFYLALAKKYDLVAHIQPDVLLNRADFSSSETLYEQVTNLKSQLKENGVLVLQTHNTNNLIIKSAATDNYLIYYREQLAQRRLLSYPPFGLLIKLTIKGKDKQKLEFKANKLAQSLKTAYKIPVTILGPYTPIFFSKQTTYSKKNSVYSKKSFAYNIILKCKLNSYTLEERQNAIEKMSPILRKIEKFWQITVEPESLN